MTNFIPSPSVKSVFSVATSVSNINEGSSINFDITATGYGTGIVYWIITGGATAADFSDTGAFAGISGKVVITNNVGRVTKTLNADSLTEGAEAIVFEVHACEPEGSLLASSSTITINDTSIGTMYTLVVAGGGGGGGSGAATAGLYPAGAGGGGGGGGGVLYAPATVINTSDTYYVFPGEGGAAGQTNTAAISPGVTGADSFILGKTLNITAKGGGGGGGYFAATTTGGQNGLNGGSGGGASSPYNAASVFTGAATTGGTGVSGQGFAGGATSSTRINAAGGGGASQAGVGSTSQPYGFGGAGITLPSYSTVTGNGFLVTNSYWGVFAGSSTSYVTVTYNTSKRLLLSASSWTIEAWIYPTSSASQVGIMSAWQIGGLFTWNLTTSLFLNFTFTDALAGVSTKSFTGTNQKVVLNSWNHVAVVRNGTTIKLYVNGQADATTYNIGSGSLYYYNDIDKPWRIGQSADGAGYFTGNISNVRVVNGTAIYTSNFTPSGPITKTSQGATASEVILLILNSSTIVDNSDYTVTNIITKNSVTIISGITPFGAESYGGGGSGWGSTGYNTITGENSTQIITGALGGGGLPGEPGVARTGGGGGGGGENIPAGAGGNGVVKIAYISPIGQVFYGGTAVVNNTNNVVTHTYNEPGFFSSYSGTRTYSISVSYNEITPDAVAGLIEGNGTVTYTINTTNYGNGILGWETLGVLSSSFSDGLTKGTVIITNDTGVVSRPTVNNTISEIPRQLTFSLKTPDYITILATDSSVLITDQYTIFPDIYNVTELGTPTAVTFTITSQAVADNTVVFWNTKVTTGLTATDFVDNTLVGTVTIQSNSATLVREAYADYLTEGAETFSIELRAGSNAGTLLSVSPVVTIGDTATTPPQVTSFVPAQGPTSGGTATPTATGATYDTSGRILINGTGFYDITDVQFKYVDLPAVSAAFTIVNATQISAVPPAFTPVNPGYPIVDSGFYQVVVIVSRGSISNLTNSTFANQIKYQYVPAPTLTSITPSSGPLLEAPPQAFVSGNNFINVITSMWDFGGTAESVGFSPGAWTEAYLTPPTRSITGAGNATFKVYTYGGVSNELTYTYAARAPVISAISEVDGGPLSGGLFVNGAISGFSTTTKLQIQGFYFTGATTLKFNGVTTPFTYVNSNRIDAVPPAQSTAAQSANAQIDAVIEITTPQGTGYSSTNSLYWRYWARPTLSSWNFQSGGGLSGDTFVIGSTNPSPGNAWPPRMLVYGTNMLTGTAGSFSFSIGGTKSIIVDYNPNTNWPGYHKVEPPQSFSTGGISVITFTNLGGPSTNTLNLYIVGTPAVPTVPAIPNTTVPGTITLPISGGFTTNTQVTGITVGGVSAGYTISPTGVITITTPSLSGTGWKTISVTTINGTVPSTVFYVTTPSLSSFSNTSTPGLAANATGGGITGGEYIFINSTTLFQGGTYNVLSTSLTSPGGTTKTGTAGEVWFGNRRASVGTVSSTGVWVTVPAGIAAATVPVTVKTGSAFGGLTGGGISWTYNNYLRTQTWLVGGGGGGGVGTLSASGGGGGGGQVLLGSYNLPVGQNFTVSVGAGGSSSGIGTASSVSTQGTANPGQAGSGTTGGASGGGNSGATASGTTGGGGGGAGGAASNSPTVGAGGAAYVIPAPYSVSAGAGGSGGGSGANAAANTGGGGQGSYKTAIISATESSTTIATSTASYKAYGSWPVYSTPSYPWAQSMSSGLVHPSGAVSLRLQLYTSNGSTFLTTFGGPNPIEDLNSYYKWDPSLSSGYSPFGRATASTPISLDANGNGTVSPGAVVGTFKNGITLQSGTYRNAWIRPTSFNVNGQGSLSFGSYFTLDFGVNPNEIVTPVYIGWGRQVGGAGLQPADNYFFLRYEAYTSTGSAGAPNIIVEVRWSVSNTVYSNSPLRYYPTQLVIAFVANARGGITYRTYPGGAGGSGRVIISYLAQRGISTSLISNSSSSSLTGSSGITGSDGLIHIYQFTNSTTAQVAAITAPIVIADR